MLVAKVSDGIWIGSESSVSSPEIIREKPVVVSLSIDSEINYVLQDTELIDDEIPAMIRKLDEISEVISELRKIGKKVLIRCDTGRNKSALMAAYFLIKAGGMNKTQVLNHITTIYYTEAQKKEEAAEIQRGQKITRGEMVLPLSKEDQEKHNIRQTLKCLTNLSFRKILS